MSNVQQTSSPIALNGVNLLLPLPYRVAIIITVGIWAWGFNLHLLSAFNIDVPNLIRYTNRNGIGTPHCQRIFRLASTASVLLGISIVLFWLLTRGSSQAVQYWEVLPLSNLLMIAVLFFLPLQRLSRTGRYRFLSTLKRICLGRIAEAHDGKFGDILLADALTSYARVLGDLAVSLCMMFTPGLSSTDVPKRDCGGGFLVPFIICIPSLIRLRQCLIEYERVRRSPSPSSGWGGQHLANALKYSTAFPVIIFNALQQHAKNEEALLREAFLNKIWFFSVLVNSVYSFYWDVTKDWDLSLLTSERNESDHPWGLRRKLHFRSSLPYYIVIAGDFILRFTWISRLTPHLDHVNNVEGGIFLLEFLEIFRRWIWIFFRVETEWVRSQNFNENIILLGDLDDFEI